MLGQRNQSRISIHALRVEGDSSVQLYLASLRRFLSTPSGWRATSSFRVFSQRLSISIHALRVEGDHGCMRFKDLQAKISIHALRVEGDLT